MVSMSAGYCVHLLGLEPSSTEVDTSVKVKVGGPKWSYHPVEFGVQYAELNLWCPTGQSVGLTLLQ